MSVLFLVELIKSVHLPICCSKSWLNTTAFLRNNTLWVEPSGAYSRRKMLLFCPTCGNVLVVEEGQRCYRFACNTCPYVHNITRKVSVQNRHVYVTRSCYHGDPGEVQTCNLFRSTTGSIPN